MYRLVEGLGQHRQWSDLLQAACLGGLNADGEKFSLYLSKPALGPNQPLAQWLLRPLAQECSTWGMKCTTHPSAAEVKHKWSYTCTSPLCLRWYITGWLLPSPFVEEMWLWGMTLQIDVKVQTLQRSLLPSCVRQSVFVAIYHIPEDCNLHQHLCENLKSQNITV